MDLELARYVTRYYGHLMTENERLAYRHLATTYKAAGGRSDAAVQAEVRGRDGARSHWLSDNSDALELAHGGLEAFLTQTATGSSVNTSARYSSTGARSAAGWREHPRQSSVCTVVTLGTVQPLSNMRLKLPARVGY